MRRESKKCFRDLALLLLLLLVLLLLLALLLGLRNGRSPWRKTRANVVGVIAEEGHILGLVAIVVGEKGADIPGVIDAASKLTSLTDVIHTDNEGFLGHSG